MDDADSDADTHKEPNIVFTKFIRHGHVLLPGYGHAFWHLSEAAGRGAGVILAYIHNADGKKETGKLYCKNNLERMNTEWN